MAGQQKKKRNHWVPQSYLRHFAADADRRKVWVLKRESNDEPIFRTHKINDVERRLNLAHAQATMSAGLVFRG